MNTIGDQIKRLRKSRGMSVAKLATLSGVSRSYLHLIEKGENSPTVDKIDAIAEALGVRYGIISKIDNLPDSLAVFVERETVPVCDIMMLLNIKPYPKHPAQWAAIYAGIKHVCSYDTSED